MERRGGIWSGEKGLGVVGRDREVCGGTARGVQRWGGPV